MRGSLIALIVMIGVQPYAAGQNRTSLNILDYGAHRDGTANSTEAFHSAIEAAKAAGGGTVYVPPGSYTTGPIELTSNLVLYIEAGATIRFPAQRLPYARGRVQGIECLQPIPLIGGTNLQNVSIVGRGVITTENADWVKLMGSAQAASGTGRGSAFGLAWDQLRELLQTKTPQSDEEYLKAAPLLRPDLVRFTDCKNVSIEGIHIVGSSFWTFHFLYSQDIIVRGVTQQTFPGIFTGGIYIDSSRDVLISDCNLDNGDDAIVLKAGKDADGLRINRPTENVAISNCIVHRGSGAIVLGSETSGWIRHVAVSNVICQGTQFGINIKSERGRGGGVEGVRIDNMTMEDVGRPISVSQFYMMQGETPSPQEPVSVRTPTFRDIAISHVTINHARGIIDFSWNPISTTHSSGEKPVPVMINIEGLPEKPIEGLRLYDIVAVGAGGLRASGAVGLELHDVQANTDSGPAFSAHDCQGMELVGVTTRTPVTDAPVIRLERCTGAVVRGSRAFPGTGTFLSVPPGELKSIHLENNSLQDARIATEEAARTFE